MLPHLAIVPSRTVIRSPSRLSTEVWDSRLLVRGRDKSRSRARTMTTTDENSMRKPMSAATAPCVAQRRNVLPEKHDDRRCAIRVILLIRGKFASRTEDARGRKFVGDAAAPRHGRSALPLPDRRGASADSVLRRTANTAAPSSGMKRTPGNRESIRESFESTITPTIRKSADFTPRRKTE